MSTEINLEKLYNNSVKILTDLIGFRTISGEDNSALINYCEDYLHKLGATSFKTFDDGRVEPMPKPGILPFFNYNRYFEWVKLFGKTHNTDGTPKEK